MLGSASCTVATDVEGAVRSREAGGSGTSAAQTKEINVELCCGPFPALEVVAIASDGRTSLLVVRSARPSH